MPLGHDKSLFSGDTGAALSSAPCSPRTAGFAQTVTGGKMPHRSSLVNRRMDVARKSTYFGFAGST